MPNAATTDTDELHIDDALVRHLVSTQFPQWAELSVKPVANGGWCNCTFHLGEQMVVRLPRHRDYAEQVEKEYRWLPRLAPLLPLPIPEPLAIGEPTGGYPLSWSIYRWLQGEPARPGNVPDMVGFAVDVGRFLSAMQSIDSLHGPPPGPHNFYRGGGLATYNAQTRQAITALNGKIDVGAMVKSGNRRWQPPGRVHRCGSTAT